MERKKRRNKRIFKIVIFLLSLLLIISITANIIVSFQTTQLNSEIKNLSSEYHKKENNLNKIKNEINVYEKNIDEIINIDKNLSNIKEDYFENIKLLEDNILAGKSDKKIVYLTFDDGPYYLTYKVLDILKENNIKATFFLIGMNKEKCYDNKRENCYNVLSKIAEEGHTLANHTYSHAIFYGLYSSTSNFINNVVRQEELIKNYTGITTNIVRFPGGSVTAGRLKDEIIKELRNRNYGWIDWTAEVGDGGDLKSKEQAWQNFINTINSNIEVLLLHDYSNYTVDLLPDMINYLKENNYLILPLSIKSNMVNK